MTAPPVTTVRGIWLLRPDSTRAAMSTSNASCFGMRPIHMHRGPAALPLGEASTTALRPRRQACRTWSVSASAAPVPDHHHRNGFGEAPRGRWSMSRRITLPSTTGRVLSAAAQDDRWGAAAPGVRLPCRSRPAQDRVRAHPGQHLQRRVPQEVDQARCVVSGVRDEGVRATCPPLGCGGQLLDHVPQSQRWRCRPPGRGVTHPAAVHELRPGSSAQTLGAPAPGVRRPWARAT